MIRKLALLPLIAVLAACSSGEKKAAEAPAAPARTDLVIERTVDAPVAAVWKAWTDPKMVQKWWGPKNYTAPVAKIDLREGGKYLLAMRGPDGKDYYSTGTYLKVEPNKSFVADDSFADAKGNIVSAAHYGLPGDFPLKMRTSVTLEKQADGKTKMVISQADVPTGQMLEMTKAGWNESFDKLDASLKTKKK